MLYNIIIKSKTSFLDRLFTYKYDEKLEIGTRVIVPFGQANIKNIGLIVSIFEGESDFDAKEIHEVLDAKPIISKELVDLAFYMIKNNISDYSSAINTILPPGSIDTVNELYIRTEELKDNDIELYNYLDEFKDFEEISANFINKYNKKHINELVSSNLIRSKLSMSKKSSKKYIEYVELKDNDFISKVRKNAQKQIEILNLLKENGKFEKTKLLEITESTNSVIKTLEEKQLIKITKDEIYRNVLDDESVYNKIKLNYEQNSVYNSIIKSKFNNFLLHGVTGSGKTEVYLQLVEHYLTLDKEAIILVPEISLTPQTISRFQGRFGNNIAVLHSKLSISERADQWRMIKNKDVKIVVGARSAIFAPFDNIGIIIIDEEHESSYKSDKNPKYSAIDIAIQRSKFHNAKLVLGTATPSVKTYFDYSNEEIQLLELNNRVNQKNLPNVSIVDMRQELKANNYAMFSKELKTKMDEALSKNEQIILFLNKRGHSSFVFCRHCGYVHRCDACDVSMTYHKSKDRLICHYCGRTALKPKKCINCGSSWIKEFGAGTEMLEEQTIEMFPNKKVFRMDSDTITKKEDYNKVYNKMMNKEIDILIGTQMLAKGLDFPNVSVVGIVSADVSLNLPDYRAKEKTFSLITQASGRAGRKDTDGNVIIQTYKPEDYAIFYAARNDYKNFYKNEIEERKLFNYPPYIKILNINISSKDRFYAINIGSKIRLKINEYLRSKNIELIEMTGPTPSIIEKVNNRYRFDIILKSHEKSDLLDIANLIREIKDNKVYINFKLEED